MKYFTLVLALLTTAAFAADYGSDVQPTEFFYTPDGKADWGFNADYHKVMIRQSSKNTFNNQLLNSKSDLRIQELVYGLTGHYRAHPLLTLKATVDFEDFKSSNDVQFVTAGTGSQTNITTPVSTTARSGFRSVTLTPMSSYGLSNAVALHYGVKLLYSNVEGFNTLNSFAPHYWDSFSVTPYAGIAHTPGALTWGAKVSYMMRTSRETVLNDELKSQTLRVKARGGEVMQGDLFFEAAKTRVHPGLVISYIQPRKVTFQTAASGNGSTFGDEQGFANYRRLGFSGYGRIAIFKDTDLIPTGRYFFALSNEYGVGQVEKNKTHEYELSAAIRVQM